MVGNYSKGNRKRGGKRQESEFDQKIIDLARVTRVQKGGKIMRFRACIALGDRKGRIAIGVAKGSDVAIAVDKAVSVAKKHMLQVPLKNGTFPHRIVEKYKGAEVLLKPAPSGSGIIAGGAVRTLLELGGVENAVAKILGSSNKINNCKATIGAMKKFIVKKAVSPQKSRLGASEPLNNKQVNNK